MTGPLAVFTAVADCDANDHPVQIITDGRTAYAWGATTDCPLVAREAGTTVLTVSCNQPRPDDDQCHGHVLFDLTDQGWTADAAIIGRLADHGTEIDR